jgi:hypothetical protein
MKATVAVLNTLREHGRIDEYAIGGAMAAMFYAEPVATYDMDVFTHMPRQTSGLISLEAIYQPLRAMGYEVQGEYIIVEGIPVQLLPAISPLHEEAIANPNILLIDTVPARVMKPEYLVAIAAQLGRPKDLARIALLREECELDPVLLADIVQRHGITLP